MRERKVNFNTKKAITWVMVLCYILFPTYLLAQTETENTVTEGHEILANRADSLFVLKGMLEIVCNIIPLPM